MIKHKPLDFVYYFLRASLLFYSSVIFILSQRLADFARKLNKAMYIIELI